MKTTSSMTLSQVLGNLEGGTKTAALAAQAAHATTPANGNVPTAAEQAAIVTQKCAELLGTDKTAAAIDNTKTASATSLVREKIAQLADATMEAEIERQRVLGAAFTDGSMRRFAGYVPILDQMGLINKTASADMPFEKWASEFPDLYKVAEELGYVRQRDEIAALFSHGQKLSHDRMIDLSVRNARELFLRGFEDVERVIGAR